MASASALASMALAVPRRLGLLRLHLDAGEVVRGGQRALLRDLFRFDRLLVLRVELEVCDRKLS